MSLPETMFGVVLNGHGGMEQLEWREDLVVPQPNENEVLIQVLASSVNNTDINTRVGWYSKSVRGSTASGVDTASASADLADGGWSGNPLAFPLIQGADCCGTIVAVGANVPESRIGERVLVRALQCGTADDPFSIWTFGSECNGAFAQFAKTSAVHALPVQSNWSDAELASLPCAYSTAEAMLQKISLKDEHVLITGASGGVGSAAIQLAKRRGAYITAMTNADKAEAIRAIGANQILDRNDAFPPDTFDAIVDVVAGPRWPDMLVALRRGGRYVTAGAIAGPIVELDVRTLYLHDLTLYGSTFQANNILQDIIRYVERGELEPLIAQEFKLKELRQAQETFLEKKFIGKIVIRHT
ncbi:MAG: alcohol dehydrogenase family protein [Cyanobacteria bacterium J06638_22]